VTKLKFTHDDSHLISVGGDDRCVLQWRLTEDDELDDADVVDEPESDGYKMDLRDGEELDRPPEHEKALDEFGDAEPAGACLTLLFCLGDCMGSGFRRQDRVCVVSIVR
jgi:hypothetical protein